VFARQEILGAVAVVLLGHEIEFDEWVDTDRMGTVSKRKGSGEAGFPHARKQYTGNGELSHRIELFGRVYALLMSHRSYKYGRRCDGADPKAGEMVR